MIQKGKISKALFVKKNKLKYSKNHFKNLKKKSCGPLTNTGKIVAVNLARNKYRKTNSNAVVSFCERLNAPHQLQEWSLRVQRHLVPSACGKPVLELVGYNVQKYAHYCSAVILFFKTQWSHTL